LRGVYRSVKTLLDPPWPKSKAEVTFGPTSCRAKLGKKVLWSLEEETSCIKDLWQLPIIPWNGKTPTAATAAVAKATAGGDATAPTDGVWKQSLTVSRDVKFLESLYYKEWKQQQQKLPSTPLIVEADELQQPSRQVEVAVSEEEMSGVTEEGGAAEVEQQQQHESPPRVPHPPERPRRDVRPPVRLTYGGRGKRMWCRLGVGLSRLRKMRSLTATGHQSLSPRLEKRP
ncbi:hypothetical protein CLOP_g943, partial [Closterium sp. NIES-67]